MNQAISFEIELIDASMYLILILRWLVNLIKKYIKSTSNYELKNH
jgi:hypothetical protein